MTAIIDRSVLDELRALGGPDDDLVGEVIGVFLDAGPAEVRGVDEALASGDAAAIQRAAHRLKGSALGVGAGRLATLLGTVELAARAKNVEGAASTAAGIDAAFEDARVELAAYLNRRSGGSNP